MCGHAAEIVQADLHTRELGHHLRARYERHRLCVHDDQVGEAEQQSRPGDDRAGHGHEDRNDAAAASHGGCSVAPAVQGGHAVEDVRTARGRNEDERDAEPAGQIGGFGEPHAIGVAECSPAFR